MTMIEQDDLATVVHASLDAHKLGSAAFGKRLIPYTGVVSTGVSVYSGNAPSASDILSLGRDAALVSGAAEVAANLNAASITVTAGTGLVYGAMWGVRKLADKVGIPPIDPNSPASDGSGLHDTLNNVKNLIFGKAPTVQDPSPSAPEGAVPPRVEPPPPQTTPPVVNPPQPQPEPPQAAPPPAVAPPSAAPPEAATPPAPTAPPQPTIELPLTPQMQGLVHRPPPKNYREALQSPPAACLAEEGVKRGLYPSLDEAAPHIVDIAIQDFRANAAARAHGKPPVSQCVF